LFSGANALALETAPNTWEILQFGTATLISTGRWRLTRLLRSQSGTEDAMVPSAPVGSRVVILGQPLVSLPITEGELGMPWNWLFGPVDRPASDPVNLGLTFTPQGRGLRPWSPVRVKGVWAGSGDIAVTWVRRSRSLVGDSWLAPEVPLGETSESYDVDVLDGGGTVVRTVENLASPTWTYLASDQTTDFGAPVITLHLRICQNGQLGRGAPATRTLTA
jgi:hypothetical protein